MFSLSRREIEFFVFDFRFFFNGICGLLGFALLA
jgi:hypothetical protein